MAIILKSVDGGAGEANAVTASYNNGNGGRLCGSPCHHHTTGAATITLNDANDWLCFSWVAKETVAYQSDALHIVSATGSDSINRSLYYADADGYPTGEALVDLGSDISFTSGTSDEWVYGDWTEAYQFVQGRRYGIVIKLANDTANVTLSYRRHHTTMGTIQYDSLMSAYTTNAGSSWTRSAQDTYTPANYNYIVGATENCTPYLSFVRHNGSHLFIPSVGNVEIPYEGINFDCSSLTADTEYFGYGYYNTSTNLLDVEASTTDFDIDSIYGIRIKSGDGSRRYLGRIYPREIDGRGYQGPRDVVDERLIMNAENKLPALVGKVCPYSGGGSTYISSSGGWQKFKETDDYKFSFITDENTILELRTQGTLTSGGNSGRHAIAIDSDTVIAVGSGMTQSAKGQSFRSLKFTLPTLDPGVHYAVPLHNYGASVAVYYYSYSYGECDVLGIIER